MPDPIQRIPAPEPLPLPTPEHQRKITRGKWFEIVTVMTLIVLGTSFLYWRSERQANAPDAAASVTASKLAIEADGALAVGSTTLLGRPIWSYRKLLAGFVAHVDLVGERDDAPLETAIIWLTPQPGAGPQSPEALQAAVDSVAITAWELVRSSALAFEKASKTMEYISDAPRPHDKGVGASDDGWKLTYVTYRSYDDAGEPEPVLCVVLQRLSAGEDEALAQMNRTLHEALHAGRDIKTALGGTGA
jgi:hypothetical protein